MEKVCPVCGSRFTAKRSTAIYCSSTCRVRALREREYEADCGHLVERIRMAPPRPVAPKPATVDNIAVAVTGLRSETVALRHFARSAPLPLRPVLTRVCDAVDEALEREGL